MEKEIKEPVIEDKPTEINTDTAPLEEKPVDESSKTLDAEEVIDDIDETLVILNIIDKGNGGKGEITEVPEALSLSVKGLIESLGFVREMFEDPLWMSIMDDMADQKEDGKTPSVEVAIARNIPLENIQSLAESEDYEGTQNELTSKFTAEQQIKDEDAAYEASFEDSKKAGEEYCAEMGYSEEERNELFQLVLDLFQIMADGKLTVEEFRKVDKMRNYDQDIADMRSQRASDGSKEVLPDQSSIETSLPDNQQSKQSVPSNTPGLASLSGAYADAPSITEIGKRKRK